MRRPSASRPSCSTAGGGSRGCSTKTCASSLWRGEGWALELLPRYTVPNRRALCWRSSRWRPHFPDSRRFQRCGWPLSSTPPGHRGRRACPSRTCPSRRRHLDGAAAPLRGAVQHLLPFTPTVPSLLAPSRTPSRQTHSRGAMRRQRRQRRSRLRSRPLWCRATLPPPPPQPERPATPRRSSGSQRQRSYSTWQCRRAMRATTQDFTTHI